MTRAPRLMAHQRLAGADRTFHAAVIRGVACKKAGEDSQRSRAFPQIYCVSMYSLHSAPLIPISESVQLQHHDDTRIP